MTDLTKRRAELIAWAQSCLDSGDRHGLRDAAADLEVIEARMEERGIAKEAQSSSAPNHPDGPECLQTEFGPIWANCSCPDCKKVEYACVAKVRNR